MPEGTAVKCPICGGTTRLGISFEHVTIVGSHGRSNIEVTCKWCGTRFDAAPGKGVTFWTDASGRLRSVAAVLAAADRADLELLLERLEQAQAADASPDATAASLEEVPSLATLGAWLKDHAYLPGWGGFLVALIMVVRTLLLPSAPAGPTPEQIARIVQQLQAAERGEHLRGQAGAGEQDEQHRQDVVHDPADEHQHGYGQP